LGGKWKLGGDLTPNGKVAKLKMLKLSRRRNGAAKKAKKVNKVKKIKKASQKNLLTAQPKAGVGGKWKMQSN